MSETQYITLAQLREWDACPEGLDWLARTVPHVFDDGFGNPAGNWTSASIVNCGPGTRWPLSAVVDALKKADKTKWLSWLSARDPRVREMLEPKREGFDPRGLQVGDEVYTASILPLYIKDIGQHYIIYELHGQRQHTLFDSWVNPITRVVRDGVTIYPPEPEWTPKVGEIALYHGTPFRVQMKNDDGAWLLDYLDDSPPGALLVDQRRLRPYTPPVDEIAKIITLALNRLDLYLMVGDLKQIAQDVCGGNIIIMKGDKA